MHVATIERRAPLAHSHPSSTSGLSAGVGLKLSCRARGVHRQARSRRAPTRRQDAPLSPSASDARVIDVLAASFKSFRRRRVLRLLSGHAPFNLGGFVIETFSELHEVQMHAALRRRHLAAARRLRSKMRRISRHRGSLLSLRRTPGLSCVVGGAVPATTSPEGGPIDCSTVQASAVAVRIMSDKTRSMSVSQTQGGERTVLSVARAVLRTLC
jgi:hypothetical protein